MNDLFPLFFGLIFLVISIVILVFNHERNLNRIRREIVTKGFIVGQIRRRWIDFDENTATYTVSYSDDNGAAYQTECKIRNFIVFPGKLYWTKPLHQHDSQKTKRDRALQIELDALRRENNQLRMQNGAASPSTDTAAHLKANAAYSNSRIPNDRLELMADLELDGLRKENEELKRQIRILQGQNKRYRKELGI